MCLATFSYTLETLIQAGPVQNPDCICSHQTNPQTRKSRLAKQHSQLPDAFRHRRSSAPTPCIARCELLSVSDWSFLTLGVLLGLRFLYFFAIGLAAGGPVGHVQSLILAAILMIVGVQICLIGLAADLIGFNRRLNEKMLYRLKRLDLPKEATSTEPSSQRGQ